MTGSGFNSICAPLERCHLYAVLYALVRTGQIRAYGQLRDLYGHLYVGVRTSCTHRTL